MKTIEYRTIDKASWANGPWQNEPDKKQWQDAATGMPCLIVRNSGGALCGYVGVAPDHPLHGKDYDAAEVDVHGGLTFADACADEASEADHICHVPDPGEPANVWWFGFDCSHHGDASPAYEARSGFWRDGIYKDISYVEREVASLAQQLSALSKASGRAPTNKEE